jgi:hypothetical protein
LIEVHERRGSGVTRIRWEIIDGYPFAECGLKDRGQVLAARDPYLLLLRSPPRPALAYSGTCCLP